MLYKYLFYWFYRLFKLFFGHMPEYSSVFTLSILGMSNVLIIMAGLRKAFGLNFENSFTYIFFGSIAIIYIINHILFLGGDKAYNLVDDFSKKYGKKHLYRTSVIIIPYVFFSAVATILILMFGLVV